MIAYAGGAPLRRTVSSSSYLSQDSRRVHFGLGKSAKADQVEVHWLDGRVDHYTALEANAIWDLTEADPLPRRYSNRALPAPAALSRQQTVEFWSKQRAAMDAMKKERNPERAIELFRAALALDPLHEDSHYYLANCLYAHGDPSGALEQLDELIRINPTSHRAYLRKGAIQAIQATSRAQLAAAEESARKALALNSEETGALLLIGEIALAGGALERADRQFELACRTNPKAVGALFLRGYIAWKAKDYARGGEFLKLARDAGGTERKPKGSVSEGDVRARMHHDTSLVARYWDGWDGGINPDDAYKDLDSALRAQNLRLKSASSR